MCDTEIEVFTSESEEREFWQHLLACLWCQLKLKTTDLGVFYSNNFEDEVFWEEVKTYLAGTHPTTEHFVEALTYGLRGLDAADLLDWFEEASDEEVEEVLESGPVEDLEALQVFNRAARPAKRIIYHGVICQACIPRITEAFGFLRDSYTNEEIMNFKF